MKSTPSSIARRRTRRASGSSLGGPQMPGPVSRMAPNPMRLTRSSPPSEIVPAADAGVALAPLMSASPLALV